MNSLYEGHIDDDTVLFVLNNTGMMDAESDELQIIRYVFTCTTSIAQLAQKHHSKEVLRPFFDELANVVSRVDDFLQICDDVTDDYKVNVLEGLKDLPEEYAHVILADAGKANVESTCIDLVIQSAINGMLMSVIEKID